MSNIVKILREGKIIPKITVEGVERDEKEEPTSQDVSGPKPKKVKEPKPKKEKKPKGTQGNPIIRVLPKDKALRKPKSPSNVLFLNPKKHRKDSTFQKIAKVVIATFYEYAVITKVNGMFYLRQYITKGWLRFMWSCIMLGLLSFATTLIYLLYRRYLDSPTRVTIASPMSINTIPFPGITICHPQNVMEYKSKDFVKRVKLPLGATAERVVEILPLLAGFTEHQWAFPRKEDLEMVDEVLDLNNMTVDDAIDELGTVCSDFLLVCSFAGKKFPCMQDQKFVTFVESYSYLGACCSFNYNPKAEESEEFFKSNMFGMNGGLSVIGTGRPQASDGKSGAIYSEGFVAIVHHYNDFAVESAPTTYLELGKETFIDAQPIHSSCSDQVLALPFSQRKCIVPADLNVRTYRQPACMLACLRSEIHKRCHCHPFHLPKENSTSIFRDCKAKDVYCFVENYFEFKTVQCDHCFPSCTEIFYKTNAFKVPFINFNYSVDPFYFETNLTRDEFIVRVYFGSQTISANKKIVVMSWISLLSNLGGSFALCLGISLLSFVEVIFFFIFRIYRHYKRVFTLGPVMPKYIKYAGRY